MRTKSVKKPPRLSLVNPSEPAVTPPSRPLGPAGRQLWDSVMTAYSIEDVGGREILLQACAATDRAEELAEAINLMARLSRHARDQKSTPD